MQKFTKGDLVMIANDLGPRKRHFTSGCEAIVIASYADEYGGSNESDYTLHIKGKGKTSWYEDHELTLIESNMLHLLEQWKHEEDLDHQQKSDLDWIFSNGRQVIEKGFGSSIQALANCFGMSNLWGSHGEGFIFYENAMITLSLAEKFLEVGDKDGWLSFCKGISITNRTILLDKPDSIRWCQ